MTWLTMSRALTVLTVLAAPTLALAAPAQAAPGDRYVALGDSYSSGLGTREYYQDSGDCKRSPRAYPRLLADQKGLNLDFAACQGATTRSVLSSQISHLTADTRYVTVSAGGNDAGFSHVITQCAKPWPATCGKEMDNAEKFIRTELPAKVDDLYRQIQSRAPRARVVVVGYPLLFMGKTCNLGTRISVAEQNRLNGVAHLLADTLRTRVQAFPGFFFADSRNKFTGHAVCAAEEWINGLSNPVPDSFHPNVAGQRAYSELISGALG